MRIQMSIATVDDLLPIVALRTAVAARLTAQFGSGLWSRCPTERGVRFEMRTSKVFVARHSERLAATLRLATKKPWAIDLQYFRACGRPLYLLAMAVTPELQGRGIGQQCLKTAVEIGRGWPADAIRLDAYDANAGAGPFYEKCGFRKVGRSVYRGCPLLYYEMLL